MGDEVWLEDVEGEEPVDAGVDGLDDVVDVDVVVVDPDGDVVEVEDVVVEGHGEVPEAAGEGHGEVGVVDVGLALAGGGTFWSLWPLPPVGRLKYWPVSGS